MFSLVIINYYCNFIKYVETFLGEKMFHTIEVEIL